MLYQRRIPDNQIVSAKLELQLRGGRYAGVGTQFIGILSLGAAALYAVEPLYLVSWALSLLTLNLWWSRRINQTLLTNRHFSQRPTVLNELVTYSVINGSIWSATLIGLDTYLSDLFFLLVRDVCRHHFGGQHLCVSGYKRRLPRTAFLLAWCNRAMACLACRPKTL